MKYLYFIQCILCPDTEAAGGDLGNFEPSVVVPVTEEEQPQTEENIIELAGNETDHEVDQTVDHAVAGNTVIEGNLKLASQTQPQRFVADKIRLTLLSKTKSMSSLLQIISLNDFYLKCWKLSTL